MAKPPCGFRRITPDVYGDRRPVSGEIVALLHVYFEDRGLKLIETKSRAMQRGEIHELMITDEQEAVRARARSRWVDSPSWGTR